MATEAELNQLISQIENETQREGNTKERVANALKRLRDLETLIRKTSATDPNAQKFIKGDGSYGEVDLSDYATEEYVDKEIENLRYGAMNLLEKSGNLTGLGYFINNHGLSDYFELSTEVTYNGYPTIKANKGGIRYNQWVELAPDTQYTLSACVKFTDISAYRAVSNNENPLHLWVNNTPNPNGHLEIIKNMSIGVTEDFKLYYLTFRTPNLQDKYYCKCFVVDVGEAPIYMAYMTLTEGNLPMQGWSPAFKEIDLAYAAKNGNVLPAGTAQRPPMIIPRGTLTTVPQDGAIERDANGDFYITKETNRIKLT